MNQDILISKIVANASESSWAQAYATLNLYIVLGLERENAEGIAQYGKSLLEKLVREFFALGEKNLTTVKQAVSYTFNEVEDEYTYSGVLSCLVKNVLYLIVFGEGYVLLKRAEETQIIAKGERKHIVGFSGFVQDKDVILLQTAPFLKKVGKENLFSAMNEKNVLEIGESLAPIVHEHSSGAEAAIVLEYRETATQAATQEEKEEPPPQRFSTIRKKAGHICEVLTKKVQRVSSQRLPRKKRVILLLVIVLGALFTEGILLEKQKQEQQKKRLYTQSILLPLQKEYDEAVSLIAVNKYLAVDKLNSLHQELLSKKNDLFKNAAEKETSTLVQNVEKALQQLTPSTPLAKTEVFSLPGTTLRNITCKGEHLIAARSDTGTILFIDKNNRSPTEVKTQGTFVYALKEDTTDAYALTKSGVEKIHKKNNTSRVIIPLSDVSAIKDFDVFLGNVYVLNAASQTIDKYTPPSFQKSSYFASPLRLANVSLSMSIDGSVWIVQKEERENILIRKFTKGKEDDFFVKGAGTLSARQAFLYTDVSFTNIYLLENDRNKILVISKNGEYQRQFDTANIGAIDSLCVNEKEKMFYIIQKNVIYSLKF